MFDWSVRWQLKFHPEKCQVMHLGKQQVHHTYSMRYGQNRTLLKDSVVEKDLGAHVDDNLSFITHCHKIISSTNSLLGIIQRTLDKDIFRYLYKNLI